MEQLIDALKNLESRMELMEKRFDRFEVMLTANLDMFQKHLRLVGLRTSALEDDILEKRLSTTPPPKLIEDV